MNAVLKLLQASQDFIELFKGKFKFIFVMVGYTWVVIVVILLDLVASHQLTYLIVWVVKYLIDVIEVFIRGDAIFFNFDGLEKPGNWLLEVLEH